MTKINQLIRQWSKGTIKTVKELRNLGYSPQALKIYTNSNWLSLIGRGAYKLFDDLVGWEGGLNCLQKENNLHVGGKSALEYKGFGHYLSHKKTKIELFGNTNDKIPKWFKKQNWMKDVRIYKTDFLRFNSSEMFTMVKENNIEINISIPELAIFELLYLVPNDQSFAEASLIFESLTSLRGDKLQHLLVKCNSIKVKRMFLYLSERYNHPWYREINMSKIFIGSGKRVIEKGGILNKKFKITVPRNYEE